MLIAATTLVYGEYKLSFYRDPVVPLGAITNKIPATLSHCFFESSPLAVTTINLTAFININRFNWHFLLSLTNTKISKIDVIGVFQ